MTKRIAPSEVKAQELVALLQGHPEASSGEEWRSTLVQLATERVVPEAWAREQTEALGRSRYKRREGAHGYRNGYEEGTLQTAAGVLRVKVPQVRGLADPSRSQIWTNLAKTSDRLKTLMVERCVGGKSQRDMAMAWEKAFGQCVLSKRAVSPWTDTLSQEDEAFRPRALSGDDVAYLFVDTVYESFRRWGSKTGVLGVWGIWVEGRKGLRALATTKSESYESGLEV